MQLSSGDNKNVSVLLELDHAIRRAESLQSLLFVIVNQTRRLVPFDQAVFLTAANKHKQIRVHAISNIATVDRNTPFAQWIERVARQEDKGANRLTAHPLSDDNMNKNDLADWNDLSPSHVYWLPLIAPLQGHVGTLWLARTTPFTDKELVLLNHLALSYAHALQVFLRPFKFSQVISRFFSKPLLLVSACLLSALLMIPVHLTALAPAEVVPVAPYVISSSMNGVVKEILVEPNDTVTSGQPVVQLDDTEAANNEAIAVEALEVAKAQVEKATRGAFASASNREVLAELAAQVDFRRAELTFARDRLKKTLLISEKNGVAVVTQPDQWAGRPVNVGEKILQIADPEQVELEIMLSVTDAILIGQGSKVRIFLDSAPLDPADAQLIRSEYEAHQTGSGILSYRLVASFIAPDYHPRIGLRGTAKLYGQKVSLFYYLFRRPITSFRQWLGW